MLPVARNAFYYYASAGAEWWKRGGGGGGGETKHITEAALAARRTQCSRVTMRNRKTHGRTRFDVIINENSTKTHTIVQNTYA